MPEEVKPDAPQDTPQYLTKEEFGKSAAYFRKVAEENASLKEMLSALVEKSADGSYKVKVTQPAAAPEKKDSTPEWLTELNALKTEIKKRDEVIAEKDRKAAEASKRGAIIDALSKGNAVNPQRDAVHIFETVKTNSEGKYVAYTKDDNGLDVETPLDAFVGNWLKGNPELVRASGKPGSGTPAGHAMSEGNADLNTLANMTPEQYIAHRKKNK